MIATLPLVVRIIDHAHDSWIAWFAWVASCYTRHYPLQADKTRRDILNCGTDIQLPANSGLVADNRQCMAGVAITRVISLWVVAGCDRYSCARYCGYCQSGYSI